MDQDVTGPQTGPREWIRVVVTIVVCLLLLGGTVGALVAIYLNEPEAERTGATRRSAALVDVVAVSRGTYRPEIKVLGRVEPARDVMLSPRVSGEVVGIDASFVPGGLVERGQVLVRLDPADFEVTRAIRQSALQEARSDLELEKGRRSVAQQEFRLLGESVDPKNRELVLREPQIAATRARVASAEASLRQAELDLSRTQVSAPFNAKILTRQVNVGSQVSSGNAMARLVGVDEYWVIGTVPLRQLRWLRFSAHDEQGSKAWIRHNTAWPEGVRREGRVARMIGTVDEETYLARVLITVPDPLAQERDEPQLVLGTVVQARIQGKPLENVVRLNRDFVRQNNTIWVNDNGELAIREADIVFSDADYAYIREGLEDGDEVVTTSLATVAAGTPLRKAEDSSNE